MNTTAKLQITGMTCAVCQGNIEETVGKLDGVNSITVSLIRKEGIIDFDNNRTTITQIQATIEELGYGVVQKQQYKANSDIMSHSNELKDIESVTESKLKVIWFNIKSLLIIGSLAILYDNTIGFEKLMLVQQDMSFGMVFVVGLITSIHCVTMCGGISLSLAMRQEIENLTWKQKMMPSLQYQLGRLISYTVLGAVVGGLGSVISISTTGKSFISMVAGIFMVAMALRMMGIADTLTNLLYRLLPRLPRKADGWMRKQKRGRAPFVVGLVNGFMPCGPLQAMQVYALQTGSIFYGGLSMFLFSLGTIPLMLVFSSLGTIRNKNLTNSIYRFGALVVLLLGLTMTNRSLLLQGIDVVGKVESVLGIESTNRILAKPVSGGQEVLMDLQPGSYQVISAQADTPTKWIIEVDSKNLNGCNNEIVIPELGIRVVLQQGMNVIELPPMSAGDYVYTCWMGMISGKINITI